MGVGIRSTLGSLWFGLWVAACQGPSPEPPPGGRLVVVVRSDMVLPSAMDGLTLTVRRGTKVLREEQSRLGPEALRLPAVFAVEGLSVGGAQVEVTVTGFRKGSVVVSQRAEVRYPDLETRTLTLGLSYLCSAATDLAEVGPSSVEHLNCSEGETCRGGQCEPMAAETTAGFDPKAVYGGGDGPGQGQCFPTLACFQGVEPEQPFWRGSRCVVARPSGKPGPFNLALVPPDGFGAECGANGLCYIPVDGDTEPSLDGAIDVLVVPEGVCAHPGLRVAVSSRCPTKTAALPVCGSWSSGSSSPVGRITPFLPPTPQSAVPVFPGSVVGGVGDGGSPISNGPPSAADGGAPSIRVVQLALGLNSAFALLSNGTMRAWGDDDYGLLAQGSTSLSIPGLNDVTHVAAGSSHVCVVLRGGTVRCWGILGADRTKTNLVTPIPGIDDARKVIAGDAHTCILRATGTVRCWGDSTYGETGGGSETIDVPGLSNVLDLAGFRTNTCAILGDGGLRCWGEGETSEEEDSFSYYQYFEGPSKNIKGISGVIQVAVGLNHTCALLRDHTLRCWGDNFNGATGWDPRGKEPEASDGSRVRAVPGVVGVAQVAASDDVTCVRYQAGTVECWGLDAGIFTYGARFSDAAGLTGFRDFALGLGFGCGVFDDGKVRCWGSTTYGQSGVGIPPRVVHGLSGVRQLALGFFHSCALLTTGSLRCWGNDYFGQLGGGSLDEDVPGLSGIRQITAGYRRNCARAGSSSVHCWGGAIWGEQTYFWLENIAGVSTAEDLAGAGNACARLSDGTLRCWNDEYDRSRPPEFRESIPTEKVPDLADVVSVAVGGTHRCASLKSGEVRCWGKDSDGQLGGSSMRTSVPGLSGVQQVAVGSAHSCALLVSGEVRCWGSNASGQLAGSSPSENIRGLSGVRSLASFDAHTCALLEDGTVRCWGANLNGQTGGASPTVPVPGVRDIVDIRTGGFHTCGLTREGTVVCWGDNAWGQSTGVAQAVREIPLGL